MRLSIIIPVYNASAYLERCVNSCMSQGISEDEYEILLCDDGSTDNSLSLANELKAKHNCIKVFSQENAGAGMARNLGLKHAKGNYVIFVDSDDYLVEGSLVSLLRRSEELDLDICKYVIECIILSTDKHHVRHSPIETDTIFTGDKLLGCPEVPLDSVCSSLYRREFLEDNGLRFNGQTSSEDVIFTLGAYPYAERVMFTNDRVYTYEVRTGSRSHSTDIESRIKYIMNNIRNVSHVKEAAQKSDRLSGRTRRSMLQRSNSMMVGSLMELHNGRHIFTKSVVSDALELATQLGVYPIKGSTFTWKSTLLAHLLLNNRTLFLRRFN